MILIYISIGWVVFVLWIVTRVITEQIDTPLISGYSFFRIALGLILLWPFVLVDMLFNMQKKEEEEDAK